MMTERTYQRINIQVEDVCQVEQLYEVNATLAAFYVRDERLMPTERIGDLSLRHALGPPLGCQRRRNHLMALGMYGLRHQGLTSNQPPRNPKFRLSKNQILRQPDCWHVR